MLNLLLRCERGSRFAKGTLISTTMRRWSSGRQQFHKHRADAGIDHVVLGYHADLYALRGSWNTHAFHAKVPAELRAKVMGHTTTKLVEDRYLLLDELATSEAVAEVDRRLMGGADSASATSSGP